MRYVIRHKNEMRRKWYIFYFLTTICSICYGQHNLTDLNNEIDSILIKQNVPGCQVIVVNSDSIIWSKNYGLTEIETKRKVIDETKFRIASITKTIMNVAVMQLNETNQWSIHDQIQDILPQYEIKNPYIKQIELIHLLEHTSGLRDLSLGTFAGSCQNCSFQEAFKKIYKPIQVSWAPGEFMSYSNWGIVLMAQAIYQKTGISYEEYIKDEVFLPLGITNASYFQNSDNQDDFAFGYKGSSQLVKLPYKHMLDIPGSLNISAIELSYFLRMLMNKGNLNGNEILSQESIESMEKTETTLLSKYSLEDAHGKGIFKNRYNGNLWLGHWGDFAGYHSSMYYNRENDIGYIILLNKDEANVYGIEKLIRNHFTQERDITSLDEITFDQKYLGYYNIKTSRFNLARFRDNLFPFIKISKENNIIQAKTIGQDEIELNVQSDNIGHYRTKSGYDRFYSFVTHKNKKHLKIGRDNYVQTSFISAWLRVLIPVFVALVFLFGLFTIPISYLKLSKERTIKINAIYLSTWLAIISFCVMMFFLLKPVIQNQVVELLGNKTLWSEGKYFSSILFSVFSLTSILLMFKNGKDLGRTIKLLILLCIVSFLIVNTYLIMNNMIGIKTWQ